MSIEMLTGTTGGGKSYHAVNHIIPEIIKTGRPVVTNLPLNISWWQDRFPDHYHLIKIVDKTAVPYADLENGKTIGDYGVGEELKAYYGDVCLTDYETGSRPHLIIDEAAGLWSKARTTDVHRDFVDHHRHFELDLLLIVQDERKLDSAIRYNVEMVHKVVNLQQQGKKGLGARYVLKTWEGNSANTSRYPDRDTQNFKFEPDGYDAYQSRMFGGNVSNKEAVGSKSIWNDWTFYLLGLMFVLALFFIFYLDGLRMFTDPASIVSSENAPVAAPRVLQTQTSPRRGSHRLTYAGSVFSAGETIYLISMDGRASRRVLPGDLLRMGIDLRPAGGCAAWKISEGKDPKLVQCGDQL